ncbi:bifunctional riboflavin kinase/FAD synthetase [Campylobacter sp. MIT 19-121]|uniref:bifunctional riboflavin kinase/FAD synthetase n=1 Tax=Campylobacter sp. MIT 19-121 TaxID=2703906 RepID=UPI001389B6F6|nr:bifunctional riboflavin kinase/FAD synthetase [Campylobacter sp. MIT 19-121]NDJ27865.1 bifunctional riboflavin kinase/FAD synthetase [Campylobacter sp. MIT 19-121]
MSSIFTCIQKDRIESLAIGRFDGMHLGHFKLFSHLDNNPALLLIDTKKPFALTSLEDKKELVDFELINVDFSLLKELSGEAFLKLLRLEFKNLKKIVVGEDFRFGKDRAFNAKDIEPLSGIKTLIVREFELDGVGVHSSKIKEFLSEGLIEKANAFLGRSYKISGELISGQGLGSKELFATLNLDTKEQYFLPKNAVYASHTIVQNQAFKSVSFIGKRLSTDEKFSIETHIIEPFSLKVLKNERIALKFKAFLRENQKFNTLIELKAQIQKDINKALSVL